MLRIGHGVGGRKRMRLRYMSLKKQVMPTLTPNQNVPSQG